MAASATSIETKSLVEILQHNPAIRRILADVSQLDLPQWYLGAGCIAQTVWNSLTGRDSTYGIGDYDLVYFDAADLSEDGEKRCEEAVQRCFKDLTVKIDVKNEARIHLWYKEHFGYAIKPYKSMEDAIRSWPTTATCIGVRYEGSSIAVYAPYGLNDLFNLAVRPNKVRITEEIYNKKIERWRQTWPELKIIPW